MFEDIILFEGEGYNLGFSKLHKVGIIQDISKAKRTREELLILKLPKEDILKINGIDILLMQYQTKKIGVPALSIALCQHLKKEEIAVAFSASEIIKAGEPWKIMGRIMQDIKLCRKYKIKMLFASFAQNKEEQAGAYELYSLAGLLGMHPDEAKSALTSFSKLLEEKRRTIAKGVRLSK